MFESIKFDCRYFRGYIPCQPNKLRNKICNSCDEYLPFSKKILIIKLGAIGDVIRSTPLAVKYRSIYPGCHITWLTHFPDVLPPKEIDQIYTFDFLSYYKIKNSRFDIAINLDKDPEAIALLAEVSASEKYGFILNNNHLDAATPAAQHKIVTGLFDGVSKENTKSYLEEIFEICHLEFQGEPYLLNYNQEYAQKWNVLRAQAGGKKIIGLNTGCGERWKTRLWPKEYWISFVSMLSHAGYYPVLLGGPAEDAQNRSLAEATGAYYPGTFSLAEFIALTSNCDAIVTQVSMMMHIATGLKKPMVLFNNIFNKYEFELYQRGVIVEPSSGCDCFYGNTCKREKNCMHDLQPEAAFEALDSLKHLL